MFVKNVSSGRDLIDWGRGSNLCDLCTAQMVLTPSPGQPGGQKKNVCDKKGRGTGKLSEERAGHWKIKELK